MSNSGTVSLLAPLNREEQAYFSVPVLARSNKLLDVTTLEIIVLDENDNNPEFKSGACFALAIPENQATNVVHTLAAADSDEGENSEISYSITSEHFFLLNLSEILGLNYSDYCICQMQMYIF